MKTADKLPRSPHVIRFCSGQNFFKMSHAMRPQALEICYTGIIRRDKSSDPVLPFKKRLFGNRGWAIDIIFTEQGVFNLPELPAG